MRYLPRVGDSVVSTSSSDSRPEKRITRKRVCGRCANKSAATASSIIFEKRRQENG